MRDELGVVAERRGIVTKHDIVLTEQGVVAKICVAAERLRAWRRRHRACAKQRGVVTEIVVVTLHGLVVAKHAPSGVALLPSGTALSPEHGVVFIVVAIDDEVTIKGCFVVVGSVSRGDTKREQVPPGRQ